MARTMHSMSLTHLSFVRMPKHTSPNVFPRLDQAEKRCHEAYSRRSQAISHTALATSRDDPWADDSKLKL